ncbi:MAG: hypothetical protein Q8O95_04610 [bacterium]|nr:hypothetical protein [bacterium]
MIFAWAFLGKGEENTRFLTPEATASSSAEPEASPEPPEPMKPPEKQPVSPDPKGLQKEKDEKMLSGFRQRLEQIRLETEFEAKLQQLDQLLAEMEQGISRISDPERREKGEQLSKDTERLRAETRIASEQEQILRDFMDKLNRLEQKLSQTPWPNAENLISTIAQIKTDLRLNKKGREALLEKANELKSTLEPLLPEYRTFQIEEVSFSVHKSLALGYECENGMTISKALEATMAPAIRFIKDVLHLEFPRKAIRFTYKPELKEMNYQCLYSHGLKVESENSSSNLITVGQEMIPEIGISLIDTYSLMEELIRAILSGRCSGSHLFEIGLPRATVLRMKEMGQSTNTVVMDLNTKSFWQIFLEKESSYFECLDNKEFMDKLSSYPWEQQTSAIEREMINNDVFRAYIAAYTWDKWLKEDSTLIQKLVTEIDTYTEQKETRETGNEEVRSIVITPKGLREIAKKVIPGFDESIVFKIPISTFRYTRMFIYYLNKDKEWLVSVVGKWDQIIRETALGTKIDLVCKYKPFDVVCGTNKQLNFPSDEGSEEMVFGYSVKDFPPVLYAMDKEGNKYEVIRGGE